MAAPLSPASLLALLAALAALAAPGAALRCWVCRSDQHAACGEPFDNRTSPAANCDSVQLPSGQPAEFCSKLSTEVGGRTVYIRSCSDSEGLCPNAPGSGLCSTCRYDLCNGGPPAGAGPPLPLLLLPLPLLRLLGARA